MGKYILQRLGSIVVTMFVVITFTFILMHLVPGGPFTQEKKLPPEIEKALAEKYHLNDPLSKQYTDYLTGILQGDFGPSFKYKGRDVSMMIKEYFPVSAQLGLLALCVILLVGVPLGVVSALRQGTWVDSAVMFFAILGVTIPSFVIATLLIYVFASKLKLLPTSRWASWKHMIMPTVAISAYSMAFVARLTRSSMLEVIRQDYIRTARAKGLSEGVVIFKHALKNALIPIITYMGPMISGVLVGSFVIEKIFAIPGMGRMFVESISNRDYTVIMGVTIFDGLLLVALVFLVDIAYGFIDPRIKINK
ncbi:MAG: ABC transporter permease [Peptostreptococcaceae bacterium]|nr:ABC transporter permease [Peptostreptococcaceae bacterium]